MIFSFCFIESTFIKPDFINQLQRFSLFDFDFTTTLGAVGKVVQPKRIGCDQAILSSMPSCWVPEIIGMIEQRHSNIRTVDRAMVVEPLCRFSPDRFPFDARVIDRFSRDFSDSAFRIRIQSEAWVGSDREQSLFGVFEMNILIRDERDVCIDPSRVPLSSETISRLFRQHYRIVRFSLPFIDDGELILGFVDSFDMLENDFAGPVHPKVNAADLVAHPQRHVMRVVFRFTTNFFHWEVSGQSQARFEFNRIDDWFRVSEVLELAELFVANVDDDRVLFERETDVVFACLGSRFVFFRCDSCGFVQRRVSRK